MGSELKNNLQNNTDYFSKIVTGDESQCYDCDLETKWASCQWNAVTSSRPKKARQIRWNVNYLIFLLSWRDCVQGIHSSWTDGSAGGLFGEVAMLAWEGAEKMSGFVTTWQLDPSSDNAPWIRPWVCSGVWPLMALPIILMQPLQTFLVPWNEKNHGGKQFACVEEVKTTSRKVLRDITFGEFQKCFT